ncbi:MAG: hypothetical protein ACFB0B_07315 [Thermonemataceae bacterium]
MKPLRLFILLTTAVIFMSTVSYGQSLVMTGNEIFEQETPKKGKQKKGIRQYKIDVKPTKQGKPIIIPSLKLNKKDRKEKISSEKDNKGRKFTSLAQAPTLPSVSHTDLRT